MRILLTNDDGIHAPGLKVLEEIALDLSSDVWVVAPETDQSGASHSITISDPLRLRQIDERHFAVRGTPTDCIVMGVREVLKDHQPDLILSGINRGQNAADDVTYSGTIAGAMEGAVMGIPSIAMSMRVGGKAMHWATARHFGPDIVRALIAKNLPSRIIMNINYPACAVEEVTDIEICHQGSRGQDQVIVERREDGRENPYFWIRFKRGEDVMEEGSDLHAINNNRIAITPLHLDLTHHQTLATLSDIAKKLK